MCSQPWNAHPAGECQALYPCQRRAICLIHSTIAESSKIYNKFILNRLVPSLDPILRRNQNGFRRRRSTISQILVLRRIIEEIRNANREMTLIFVDSKKAFDSVDRQAMFKILTSRPVRNSTRNSQYHQSVLYRHQGKSANL